jgi:hypothetical protein
LQAEAGRGDLGDRERHGARVGGQVERRRDAAVEREAARSQRQHDAVEIDAAVGQHDRAGLGEGDALAALAGFELAQFEAVGVGRLDQPPRAVDVEALRAAGQRHDAVRRRVEADVRRQLLARLRRPREARGAAHHGLAQSVAQDEIGEQTVERDLVGAQALRTGLDRDGLALLRAQLDRGVEIAVERGERERGDVVEIARFQRDLAVIETVLRDDRALRRHRADGEIEIFDAQRVAVLRGFKPTLRGLAADRAVERHVGLRRAGEVFGLHGQLEILDRAAHRRPFRDHDRRRRVGLLQRAGDPAGQIGASGHAAVELAQIGDGGGDVDQRLLRVDLAVEPRVEMDALGDEILEDEAACRELADQTVERDLAAGQPVERGDPGRKARQQQMRLRVETARGIA